MPRTSAAVSLRHCDNPETCWTGDDEDPGECRCDCRRGLAAFRTGATPVKAFLYRTAQTTRACAGIAAGQYVAVRYSHTGANGVDWYALNDGTVVYPAHHLTAFRL